MKINQIPKQEDVVEIDSGSHKISVVNITAESKDYLVETVFSTYLGEKCKYCGKKYKTIADLKDTVWAGDHKHGRLACRSCWFENNKVDTLITKHEVG